MKHREKVAVEYPSFNDKTNFVNVKFYKVINEQFFLNKTL